jgi:hypothetical protein
MVKFFVKAVVTGFGLALGAALFKQIQTHIGLDDPKDKSKIEDNATDPGLVS